MAFEWLEKLQRAKPKDPGYAERTLAAYALGLKAGGPIVGVAIEAGEECCAAARDLVPGEVYDPKSAPRLPLPGCDRASNCQCVYRPVMSYHRAVGRAPRSGVATMSNQPSIVVVGADGFVGNGLARALGAERVVYGRASAGEVHVSACAPLLERADVVVFAHGFRVRPGCAYADYQRSHEGATAALVPHLRKGALLLHISSASVLGKGTGLGNRAPPNPRTFPSPSYALAKHEEDRYLERVSVERGFRVIFLRPSVVYSSQGAGMVDTLLKLARKGITLRLYPREARHHLCHMDLLAEVARRAIARSDLDRSYLVVADPYTVTNSQLEDMTRPARRRHSVTVPFPLPLVSGLLRFAPSSRIPRLDLRTQGEIFGVLHMDTVYDPSETMRLLGLDPADYALEKTLEPVVAEALRA